ncbi:Hyperosmotically inducible protein [Candidatus Methylobacter favarea]|uniref:Hyperosmotically inducible protein n=1 Tax=Candidatus Methylobacter favarea TaxID=2707345 RepID=A0A8S0Y9U0_9GAMM|nr:BON domain-containing protein [Candidatus Methylobacter favarea]CAA9890621.1 Hyperosmotically inducible protein [Candidatus Methylobacter favarea]
MKTKNAYRHLSISERAFIVMCLSSALGLAGCQQGSEEKAEQKIDESTERTTEKLEGAKETVEDRAEQAKENIDKSAEATKENLEYKQKRVEEAGEKAKDTIEESAEKTKESIGTKTQSAENVVNDSVITTKIKTEFLADPLLKSTQISVTTVGGVASLSGAVDSQQSIDRALQIARNVKGVKSVENNLVVSAVPDKR